MLVVVVAIITGTALTTSVFAIMAGLGITATCALRDTTFPVLCAFRIPIVQRVLATVMEGTKVTPPKVPLLTFNNRRCDDQDGYVHCSCSTGFTGVSCDSCAPGYTGYPNCTFNSTDSDDEGDCLALLIPSSLNTPAYLGYTGHTRIFKRSHFLTS